MLISGDNVLVQIINNTLNQFFIVPYVDGTFTETPIYKEKKVWKNDTINKYIKSVAKLDINSVELSKDVRIWFQNKNNLTVQLILDPEDEQIIETITECKFSFSEDFKDENLIINKISIEGKLSI